ncbi:MAG TPA: helix-turn-helix domain-containing protein [Anaerolineae bacterium]|nr:helix-turn-helix domain-containing protein [Anaerolineae bacterium]
MKNDKNHSAQHSIDDLILLRDAAKISGLSPNHLRLLVRRGDIWGRKLGRDWFTTEEAVREYVSCEHRTGPKPKKRL